MLRKLLLRWIERLNSQEDDTDIEEIVKVVNDLSDYGKDRSHRCG